MALRLLDTTLCLVANALTYLAEENYSRNLPMRSNLHDSSIVVDSLSDGEARCSFCRRVVPSEQVYYSHYRDVLCLPCQMMEKKANTQRLANSVRTCAYLSALLALISIFFNPFFVFSVPTLASGIGPLVVLIGNCRVRERLGPQSNAVLVSAASGALVGILVVVVNIISWEFK